MECGPGRDDRGGRGVCELCFKGASAEEIAACEMRPDPDDLESKLLRELEKKTGLRGNTIIAFCLAGGEQRGDECPRHTILPAKNS